MDTNRINIPMPDDCISACAFAQEVVHAIVEIHVLAESNRLRIEPSVSGVQTACNIPGSGRSSAKRKGTTALRGASSLAAAFWPMSGPSQNQRESHESSLTSCSGQVVDADFSASVRPKGRICNHFLSQNGYGRKKKKSDLQHAVQGMTEGGKARIKRVVEHLVGAKRLVWKNPEMEDDDERVKVGAYVDSDWASGWSRKSTSAGMLTASGVGVKHWSRTPKARALRSGERQRTTRW